MTQIKTQAVLGKGDHNGLVDLGEEMAQEVRGNAKRKLRPCLALVVPRRITIDGDTGDEVVTVAIVRIEPLLDEDLDAAQVFILRALEKRLGQTTLPFDLQHDLEAAFAGIDFDLPASPDGDAAEEAEGHGGPPDPDEPEDPEDTEDGSGDGSADRSA